MSISLQWPTRRDAPITQRFGEHPENYKPFGFPGHEGIDWGVPTGTPVYAVADGVIGYVNQNPNASPYGVYLSVQHQGGNYETLYAHLSQVTVTPGEQVTAGKVIALSGNTGNSTDSHLHFTLKKRNATANGETRYPKDVVDPYPYLVPSAAATPQPTSPAQTTLDLQITAEDGLNLRSAPVVGDVLATLPYGAIVGSLEARDVTRSKLGQPNQWLSVRAPDGQAGYVAALYVNMPGAASFAATGAATGQRSAAGGEAHRLQVNAPDDVLKLRQGPGLDQAITGYLPHATLLESLEAPAETVTKVGKYGQWLRVRTLAGQEGYVAAWYLNIPSDMDARRPSQPKELPVGVSPYIFGIHAVALHNDPATKSDIRRLYDGINKKGWILFTEQVGHDPNVSFPPQYREWLCEWADQGYGVIVRLNNGYEGGGTLPESKYYDGFATACARFAEQCLKRDLPPDRYTWTIVIANEQNNPREHPGGEHNPLERITPELYAQAFNKTYARIKAVLPNAVVCPGAIDPYNYLPWKRYTPLEYFRLMLANITELDGIALHAYTHGPSIEAITSLRTFGRQGENPLYDHYYDFQTYRLFIENIPPRWKHVPVYITEINHLDSGDPHNQCWVNDTRGWVSAVYAEINRWNSIPQAQQICAGLLYRWTGDQWQLDNKPGVHNDFRQALTQDYRWRRAGLQGVSFGAPVEPEEMRTAEPDDLQRIKGIGPKIAALLIGVGIGSFKQVAALTAEQLKAVLGEGGLRGAHVATWPERARMILQS